MNSDHRPHSLELLSVGDFTPDMFQEWVRYHLQYTLATNPDHASLFHWRIAVSHTIRDLALKPWIESTRRTWAENRKRVYYLSMEFLIGRLLEDMTVNLGVRDVVIEALGEMGLSFETIVGDEPDAALGNGGLGRLAACYMESMATLGCPAYGYGLRYEHGLFKQSFDHGQQVESPEGWLTTDNPWNFTRPESRYEIGFRGYVEDREGRSIWQPEFNIAATAHDSPVVGYGATWANTLRLWAPLPDANLFDLERFNAGDYTAAAQLETWARTLSRVLYPNDSTEQGKELRLMQEYFLTSASVQDIVRRHLTANNSLTSLPQHAAIQLNDTHPAIAGPELIRLLTDEHGLRFDDATRLTTQVLGYTNHTLLPEAIEQWSLELMRKLLPRHLHIIERLDTQRITLSKIPSESQPETSTSRGLIADGQVRMGNLAFVISHTVNGVSALHTDLVRENLFPEYNRLYPGRIVNITNGVTPRRWIKSANPGLAELLTDTIGEGWETDLERLHKLEAFVDDSNFHEAFGRTKQNAKARLARLVSETQHVELPVDALFDVQAKRIHEYKRQLLNILWTIAHWKRIKEKPTDTWVPRVKIFAGKAAPSYVVAKNIIRLINDVAEVINADPDTSHALRIAYPANYSVSMAERIIPAADLSEQISTAGWEASGTGNMKLALNGAVTIGTLDGANVEIRERVGSDNFFLFGLTADEAEQRQREPDHARTAITNSEALFEVLRDITDGVFSPQDPSRYHALVDQLWNDDRFLVTSDFDSYDKAQADVDRAYAQPEVWQRMAVLNIARMGYFSSDRSVRDYMKMVWDISPAL